MNDSLKSEVMYCIKISARWRSGTQLLLTYQETTGISYQLSVLISDVNVKLYSIYIWIWIWHIFW